MTATATRPAPAPARPDARRWSLVVVGCVAAAAVSLVLPATLGYDAWAWLVWGREIAAGTLDTTGGPSWKPLPVALTTLLAPLGDLAVPLYAIVARTGALLAVVAVAALAARLARAPAAGSGRAAAAVAVVALLLVPDGDPRFLRVVLEGHEAPWSMGLAAAAVLAVLDRRPGRALAWTWLLALLRPEAWPFLLLVAAWAAAGGRARRSARSWWQAARGNRSSALPAALALASIPVVWFVPDWIGSGSPLHGASTAQVLADEAIGARLVGGVATAAGQVPVAVWLLAGVAVALGRRRADPVPACLAGGALAWSALVVAMAAVLGYAAISRFFLPSAGVLVALAAAGAVRGAAVASGWPSRRRAAAVAVAVAAFALALPRVAGIPAVVDEVADRGRLADDLDAVIEQAGGAERLARCGEAVVTARTLLRSAAAWHLELPLHAVERELSGRTAVLLLESDEATRLARSDPGAEELAAVGRWTAFASRCPAAASE